MKIKSIIAASLLLSPLASYAANDAVSYSEVALTYYNVEKDSTDDDASSYAIEASAQINQQAFIFGAYNRLTYDFDFHNGAEEAEVDTLSVGAGYIYSISSSLDLNVAGVYYSATQEFAGRESDTSAYSADVGMRGRLVPEVQYYAGISYLVPDEGDNSTVIDLSIDYFFTQAFAIGAVAEVGDEDKSFGVQASYHF